MKYSRGQTRGQTRGLGRDKLVDLVVTNLILIQENKINKLADKLVDIIFGFGHDQYNSVLENRINKLVDKLLNKTRGLGQNKYNSDPRD